MDLRVNEVAKLLEETPNVIRNWQRDFKGLIPAKKGENGYNMYPPEAVEVFRTIKRLHRVQGYSMRQIEHYLSGGELAAAVESPGEPGATTAAELVELREMMQQLIQEQQESRKQQAEFNQALVARLDQRDKLITEYIIERRHEQKLLEQQRQAPPTLLGRLKGLFGRDRE